MRWALCDQARHPNETNLDTHYHLPEEGLWNKYVRARQNVFEDAYIEPRACASSVADAPSGPRTLVSNEPASKDNYGAFLASPKPPPAPSTSAHPMRPAELVPKLRWANIGWSYHWGSKQYDFSKGRGTIDERIQSVCKDAVGRVPWDEVFGDDQSAAQDWGDDGPDWRAWGDTYGASMRRSSCVHVVTSSIRAGCWDHQLLPGQGRVGCMSPVCSAAHVSRRTR